MPNRLANRLRPLPRLLLSAWLLLGLSACSERFLFEQSQELPSETWSYRDSIVFEFDIADNAKLYDLLLDVEHSDEYRFANLYAWLRVDFPDGRSRSEQVSLELADQTGRWLGSCRGKDCSRRLPFMPKAAFEQQGRHRIVLLQYNRTETMPGIRGFALRIREYKET